MTIQILDAPLADADADLGEYLAENIIHASFRREEAFIRLHEEFLTMNREQVRMWSEQARANAEQMKLSNYQTMGFIFASVFLMLLGPS